MNSGSKNHSDKTTRLLTQLRSPPQPKEQRTAVGTGLFLPNHSGVERYINQRATFEHLTVSCQTSQHALNVVQHQTSGDNITAVNVTSLDVDSSAMWLTGHENDKGTLKIAHVYPNVSDANAAAISIDLQGASSACQGIFMDSDGSTGKMAQWRNNGVNKFEVYSNGDVTAAGSVSCASVVPTNGASGSFTTADAKTVTVTNGIITSIV